MLRRETQVKILKIFGWGVGIALLLIVILTSSLFLLLLYRPEVLFNQSSAQGVIRQINKHTETTVSADELQIQVSHGALRKTITLQSARFCINIPNTLQSCTQDFQIIFSAQIKNWLPIVNVLSLKGRFENITLPESFQSVSKSPGLKAIESNRKDLLNSIIAVLGYSEELNIEINEFTAPPITVKGPILLKTKSDQTNFLSLSAASFQVWDKSEIKQPIVGGAVDLEFSSNRFQIETKIKLKNVLIESSLQGLSSGLYKFNAQGKFNLTLDGKLIALDKCRFEGNLTHEYFIKRLRCFVHGDANLIFNKTKIGSRDYRKVTFPIDLQVNNSIIEAQLGPFEDDLLQVTLNTKSSLEEDGQFNLDAFINESLQSINGKLTFKSIKELAKEVPELPKLPAPLNDLDGSLTLTLTREIQESGKVIFEIDLDSGEQKLLANGDAVIYFGKQNIVKSIKAKAELKVVLINLPNVSPQFRPEDVFPDKRFGDLSSSSKRKNIDFSLEISSADRPVVKVRTPWFENLIPMSVEGMIKSEGLESAAIVIKDTPIKFFKRNAKIQHLRISINSGETDLVDGTAQVYFGEYTINIRVVGPVDSPNLVLTSDPPLSQTEIYSVLIFGKSIDALSPEENGSVQSMESAVADGIFSFSSLYLLAATPIESVSYLPENSEFRVRFRIAKGTLLKLGGDTKNVKSLGISRSLGNGWFINYDIERDDTGGDFSGTTVIERILRY